MGHPVAVGQSPAYDFSVSDEQKAVFLVSVSDCSECDLSGLDHPNSSWSIARLKKYLRKKEAAVELSFGNSPARHLQETKSHKTSS